MNRALSFFLFILLALQSPFAFAETAPKYVETDQEFEQDVHQIDEAQIAEAREEVAHLRETLSPNHGVGAAFGHYVINDLVAGSLSFAVGAAMWETTDAWIQKDPKLRAAAFHNLASLTNLVDLGVFGVGAKLSEKIIEHRTPLGPAFAGKFGMAGGGLASQIFDRWFLGRQRQLRKMASREQGAWVQRKNDLSDALRIKSWSISQMEKLDPANPKLAELKSQYEQIEKEMADADSQIARYDNDWWKNLADEIAAFKHQFVDVVEWQSFTTSTLRMILVSSILSLVESTFMRVVPAAFDSGYRKTALQTLFFTREFKPEVRKALLESLTDAEQDQIENQLIIMSKRGFVSRLFKKSPVTELTRLPAGQQDSILFQIIYKRVMGDVWSIPGDKLPVLARVTEKMKSTFSAEELGKEGIGIFRKTTIRFGNFVWLILAGAPAAAAFTGLDRYLSGKWLDLKYGGPFSGRWAKWIGVGHIRPLLDEQEAKLSDALNTYLLAGNSDKSALPALQMALQNYDQVWEQYRSEIIMREFKYHYDLWYQDFVGAELASYNRRRYIGWLKRGHDFKDLDFVYNGRLLDEKQNEEFLKSHETDFSDPQSPLFEAVKGSDWHSDPREHLAEFNQEYSFFQTLYFDNNLANKTNKEVIDFLSQMDDEDSTKITDEYQTFKEVIRPYMKGAYKLNQAPIHTAYFDSERKIPMPYNIAECYAREYTELAKIFLRLADRLPKTGLLQDLSNYFSTLDLTQRAIHRESAKQLFGIIKNHKIPALTEGKVAQLNQNKRGLLATIIFSKFFASLIVNNAVIRLKVHQMFNPLEPAAPVANQQPDLQQKEESPRNGATEVMQEAGKRK